MLLRNKFCKTTAIAIAAISLFGTQLNTVNAYQGINQITEVSQEISKSALQNGEYKLKNIIPGKSETALKSYRAFFTEETKLVVKDGKYYLTFTNTMAQTVPTVEAKIGENNLNITTKNIDENTYEFMVELSDLSSTIAMSFKMEAHNFNCDVTLDMDSLEVIKLDDTQQPQVPQQPQGPQQSETPEVEDKEEVEESKPQDSEYKDGLYNLNNTIDHKMPQMIRSIFGEKTSVELKDGKTYVTFNLPNYDYVGAITITVDGKVVAHTQENSKTDKTATLKLEVTSLDSAINMTMYSPITKKDSVFGVKLDKSTMQLVQNNQDTNKPSDSTTNETTNNNSNTTTNSNSTSNSTSNVTVENVAVKGERYTIDNDVTAESTVAKNMGRKYLNKTSKIEEVEGKTYAVLTFTGLNMMNNHRIYVNGSKVSHQVVAKTSDSVTVRFLIPSVDANIKVQVYVVPMSFDSEFNVKLIKGTEGPKESFDTTSSLPQTGSILGSTAMLMAGTAVTGLGLILNRKKKNN